jgi:two-component system chemotaxis sensor kinase CheA
MLESRYAITADSLSIFQDFLGEAPQLLEVMEAALLALAAKPSASSGQAPVDAVMRSLHTLKGIFGFLGMEGMNGLCHRSEGVLEPYQSGDEAVPAPLLQWELRSLDAIRAQMQAISQGMSAGSFEILDLADLNAAPAALEAGSARPAPSPSAEKVRPEAPAIPSASLEGDGFIRIRVEKMDALLELVGEMAICQSQVGEGLRSHELPPALASELGRLTKLSREMQESVLSLRLVPVEPLFLRASRVAHDISQRTGKALDWVTEGKDTELDKRMVEELSEPLLHLIRNAVDHGLEDAAGRKAAGKSAQGRVLLRASHQGGDLLLELEDDGRGLDLAALAARGKALGLLQAGEEHDEARITNLIFAAGFSTASAVTDISGRGVGLDAVRSRVQALKGDIQVKSLPGQGCRFSLRLPLTMALVEGILVRVGGERYVIPAGQIRKFEAFDPAMRHSLGQAHHWLEASGKSLPLLDLGRFQERSSQALRPVALHVESLGRQAVLIVDEVLGKQQVVAKGLGAGLQSLDAVGGGAILGDGRVSLILDLEALLSRERTAEAA